MPLNTASFNPVPVQRVLRASARFSRYRLLVLKQCVWEGGMLAFTQRYSSYVLYLLIGDVVRNGAEQEKNC